MRLTVFFEDRDPVEYALTVPPRRTLHQRLGDLTDPEPIPPGLGYSYVVEADVPVVVQHTRLDSRQAANAVTSTIAYPAAGRGGRMSKLVADHILERLEAWGVRRIYGYPGDGINGIVGALDRAQDSLEFVQVRHEEMAAFMACGHAKFTGEVGVCLATSGPGAIHLLNGLYDAKLDHQPVVAIVGQQARAAIGGQLPAGGRPAVAVQGRRRRVRADGEHRRADPPPDRSRGPDRAHASGRSRA